MKAENDNLSPLLRTVLDALGQWAVIEGEDGRQDERNPKS
jgi:hypothetical protein